MLVRVAAAFAAHRQGSQPEKKGANASENQQHQVFFFQERQGGDLGKSVHRFVRTIPPGKLVNSRIAGGIIIKSRQKTWPLTGTSILQSHLSERNPLPKIEEQAIE